MFEDPPLGRQRGLHCYNRSSIPNTENFGPYSHLLYSGAMRRKAQQKKRSTVHQGRECAQRAPPPPVTKAWLPKSQVEYQASFKRRVSLSIATPSKCPADTADLIVKPGRANCCMEYRNEKRNAAAKYTPKKRSQPTNPRRCRVKKIM